MSTAVSNTLSGARPTSRSTDIRAPDILAINIEDVVNASKPPGSKTDVAKLEAEVNYLRRTIKDVKSQRWNVLPVRDTIHHMIFGQPYTLEPYKSKEQKLQLIDEAIKCHDGDTIIMVVLFLRDTVRPSIFNLELIQRPLAIAHYVSYLKQAGDTAKLMDVYGMLARSEDAAMLKFKQAILVKDPEKKSKTLEACKQAHFDSEPSLSDEARLIQEQIIAISQQLAVEVSQYKPYENIYIYIYIYIYILIISTKRRKKWWCS
ncbi:hypothetical protein LSH36_177g02001 [Paralvinella palmiformis]|uniref:Vps16 C-terminal domain-containing protein n=1 Tax=Paralvinella palmiformis TaxID=53620 RepID=A0AAD9N7A6_9ANNE|nr:hypothetical protein LSH36_177g02001 [Paralvinella palmiformis]